MRIRVNKSSDKKVVGIRIDISQSKPYDTHVAHPFIAHDMSFKVPSTDAEDTISHASRDYPLLGEHNQDEERRVIVRLPTSPVIRGRRADILGDLLWLLGREGRDTQRLLTSDRFKDKNQIFNQKVVYGVESFPAKRWAIRLDDINIKSSSYEKSGIYESKIFYELNGFKAVWLDVYNMVVPEGCEMKFYIKIFGESNDEDLEELLEIYPRNINYYGGTYNQLDSPFLPPDTSPGVPSDKITRYVFSPTESIAPYIRYVDKSLPVYSAQVVIKLQGTGNETPILDGYSMHTET